MFALVDCNNFYASCERVFNPRLAGRPVVVLSNNEGCVIARSNEAKALNIAMGAPYHEVEKLCRKERVDELLLRWMVVRQVHQGIMFNPIPATTTGGS